MFSFLIREDKQEILNNPVLKRSALGSMFVYFHRWFSSLLPSKHLRILYWIENLLIIGRDLHKKAKKEEKCPAFQLATFTRLVAFLPTPVLPFLP